MIWPSWLLLPILKRYWYAYHYFLTCAGPIALFRSGVMCTTIINFHPWCFVPHNPCTYPTYSTGYNLYRMDLPWWMILYPYSYCLTYLMIYCGHLWYYVPLQPRPGFVHPWGLWWTTLQMLGGCYISSVPWTLIFLLLITCIPPTISSWYPCINWRLVMRMRIIGWTTS